MAKYTLTSYDPVEVVLSKPQVPQDFALSRLEPIAQYSLLEDERTVRMFDYLTITTTDAKLDGNPAVFMNREHVLYQVGSGEMPQGFDMAIVGMQVDDTREVSFAVASALGPEAGRSNMRLTVHVEGIYSRSVPELTDELVAQNFAPLKTVEELDQAIIDEYCQQIMPSEKGDPEFANEILKVIAQRLVEEPDPADAMPEMGEFELRATCATDAFADHLDMTPTYDQITDFMPGDTHEEKMEARERFEAQGFARDLETFVRRELTLAYLIQNATIRYE